jgi:hypothetical protein
MGQTITVTSRQGSRPEVRFFDTNRSLTGMEIERYSGPEDVHWQRPPDVLAQRLFDLGATIVTIYSNVVTVEAPAEKWPELEPRVEHAIEHLFHYYGEDAGWSPAALGGHPAGDGAGGDGAGGDGAAGEAAAGESSAIPPV